MKHRANAGAAVHNAVKNAREHKDSKDAPKHDEEDNNSTVSSEISDVDLKAQRPQKSTQDVGTIVGGGVEVVMPRIESRRSNASLDGPPLERRSSSKAFDHGPPKEEPHSGAPPPTATNKSGSSKGSDKLPTDSKGSDKAPTSSKGSDKPPSASKSSPPSGSRHSMDRTPSPPSASKASDNRAPSPPSASKASDDPNLKKAIDKNPDKSSSSKAAEKPSAAKASKPTPEKAEAKQTTPPKAPVKESSPPKAEKAADPKPSKAAKDPVPTKEKDVAPKASKTERLAQKESPDKPPPSRESSPEKARVAPVPEKQERVQVQQQPILAVKSPEGSPKKESEPSPKSSGRSEGLAERGFSFMRVEHNPRYRDSGIALMISEHSLFEPVCLLVIVLNAIWIGVELDLRDPDAGSDDTPLYTDVIENIFCGIFTLEILLRMVVYKKFYYFFIDPLKWMWNIFDLSLVLLLVLETWILKYATDGVEMPALSSLRLLRLLRIVRVLRMVPELSMMVKSLVAAIRSVSMTFLLAVGIMYIFSILLTQWARDYVPDKPCEHPINCVDKAFGTISKSFLTLMQILCFDATFSLIRAILDESVFHGLLLILFILIAAFTVLNMLIGVVCEIVAETNEGEREKVMRDKVIHLFASLDVDGSGYISHEEMKNPEIPAELAKAGIENDVLQSTLKILETRRSAHNNESEDDGQLELDEFLETIFKLLHPPEAQDILLILRKLERLEKALTDNVIVVPKGKAVGPSMEVQKKIAALQQQVAAMTRHTLEANAVYAGDSASAEYAWDHEVRQLDKAMIRLRVRLERCVEEQEHVDEGGFVPAELKHWRLLCSEVCQSLRATGDLIVEGLKDHLVEKPLPSLTADLTPFPQPFPQETQSVIQPSALLDSNDDMSRNDDFELSRKEMEQRRDAEAAWDSDLSRGRAPKCPQGHACMFFFTPEDGWVCDSCDSEQAAGTGMWGCRQCEFDFCKDCSTRQELGQLESIQEQQPLQTVDRSLEAAPPAAAAVAKAPKCPVGHTCELFYTDQAGWTCDICRREQASGTPMWGCRQCDQDFCQSCSERQLQAPKCLLGHICTLFITDEEGWICDICQEEQARGTELWACRLCEQDFCQSCGDNVKAPRPPECPEGHPCESFLTSEYGWICDICNEEQVERTEMWGCRQCEFDACMRCAAFKVASGGSWGETAV